MKKSYLAIAVMALVLGVTACSSQTEETTAQSEETTQGTSEETEAEDVEVDYFDGSVNVVEEFVVTVADAEGTERKFDISDAAMKLRLRTMSLHFPMIRHRRWRLKCLYLLRRRQKKALRMKLSMARSVKWETEL